MERGSRELRIEALRDGYLPAHWSQAKDIVESLKQLRRPDLIFTHERDDRHQDHRLVCELTWNTFRDHTIFEYEIPKYDGGLGQPNLYVPIKPAVAERKIAHLLAAYGSQRGKRVVFGGNLLGADAPAWPRVQRRGRACRSLPSAQAHDLEDCR